MEASTYLLTGDDDGTTEPLSGMTSLSVSSACGQTLPTRLGVGAATVRVASEKSD